ncbi:MULTISPECIES: branched-chain amino acid ABC transporter permease [Brucella/Ochrobactrum group]|jgi:branched-chain amino acid transport system permease protein|uniref:Inner-membrane translocator n=4 Tax=Brucella TaxID=234 RepID=A6X796_BRUA4|nr:MULTISPECIES: branched-chain amino acid ABC transporter permease [Brucella/Ochrobactrum group]MCR5942352.1 branched-chain amino acid ABC transporter permease [Ochrobactrum sp. XJ1]QOD66267.1 branched-chain amino acid ABC transporter permease [Ochrobactrum sp. MT180101]QTN04160.1 branched-chain amino acid ABC transporter permease [Ochrobactrum sp. EEELCW01]RNL42736.1 branched-chain amino acid ABC transporter permease [Ochrobactrum sp. MH181795]ABS17100.1 inner-membrane translocator [Brucella
MTLIFEQLLNGLLYGVMLFLLAAGLTLIFGIMGVINLAHGSLYMIGAFIGTWVAVQTGNFWLGLPAAILAATIAGIVIELGVMRKLYQRDHLDQVLATFSLILIFNELTVLIFGRQPIFTQLPASLSQPIELFSGLSYPPFRLLIIVAGLLVAGGLYLLINRTRIGMLVRAGSTNRDMVRALGVDIRLLYTLVFALGAAFAGLAGFMTGPILAVQVGMGEQILLATFVVVVIGGVGSIKGAFIAGISLGIIDTCLRAFLPSILRQFMAGAEADALGVGIASMGIYLLMAIVLLFRPRGLFPVGA